MLRYFKISHDEKLVELGRDVRTDQYLSAEIIIEHRKNYIFRAGEVDKRDGLRHD